MIIVLQEIMMNPNNLPKNPILQILVTCFLWKNILIETNIDHYICCDERILYVNFNVSLGT